MRLLDSPWYLKDLQFLRSVEHTSIFWKPTSAKECWNSRSDLTICSRWGMGEDRPVSYNISPTWHRFSMFHTKMQDWHFFLDLHKSWTQKNIGLEKITQWGQILYKLKVTLYYSFCFYVFTKLTCSPHGFPKNKIRIFWALTMNLIDFLYFFVFPESNLIAYKNSFCSKICGE